MTPRPRPRLRPLLRTDRPSPPRTVTPRPWRAPRTVTPRPWQAPRITPASGPAGRVSNVPRYEYRCRACGDTFELTRPMTESSAPCTCPQGHDDTVKLLWTGSRPAVRPVPPVPAAGVAAAGPAAAASPDGL